MMMVMMMMMMMMMMSDDYTCNSHLHQHYHIVSYAWNSTSHKQRYHLNDV